jgi:hypothetical protein
MADFLRPISQVPSYKEDMLGSTVLDNWLDMTVRQADNDGRHSAIERTAAISNESLLISSTNDGDLGKIP